MRSFDSARMRDPDVLQLLQRYDVLIMTETHGMQRAAAADGLPGFVLFHADRAGAADEAAHSHGGVAVFVRAGLSKAVERVQLSAEGFRGCEVVWLRVKREHTPGERAGLLLGGVYLAPESSSVYKPKTRAGAAEAVFEALEAQVAALRRSDEPVLIAGDLNARAGSWAPGGPGLADMADVADLPTHLDWHPGAHTDGPVLRPARPNEDGMTNLFGKALCEFCCMGEFLICNGRVAGDTAGATTHLNANDGRSTVDLYVASADLFPRCVRLAVLPMQFTSAGREASDHKPVELVLDIDVQAEPGKPAPRRKGPRVPFGPREWAEYSAALAGPLGQAVLAELQACASALAEGSTSATAAVDTLGKLLARMQRTAGRIERQAGPAGPGREDAPWWNQECELAHVAREKRRLAAQGRPRTSLAWKLYRAARRKFNRARRAAKTDFERDRLRSLISECRENPRKLWDRLRGPKAGAGNIPAERWKAHFEALLNAGHVDEAHEGEVDRAWQLLKVINDVPEGEDLLECEGVAARRIAAEPLLNAPLALEEVEGALRRLPNGKARGPERVPAEAYKHAVLHGEEGSEDGPAPNLLAPFLAALFGHIFSSGDLPEQFTVAHLTPVYKHKGDDGDPGNYRGIAVAGALAKCYAMVLLRRLVRFGEEVSGVRHPNQAGFRKGLSTMHHLLCVRHLTERHSAEGSKPLFIVQVDFEKAFDRVDRATLWKRLAERGVSGLMLAALRKAYERVEMRVKVDGVLGEAFSSRQGVKQGCPLSTELFGLFIEAFADYVDALDRARERDTAHAVADDSPMVDGHAVPELMFADDLSLMALSVGRVQWLLDRLAEFCEAFGMRVNLAKCELLIFASPSAREAACLEAEALRLQGNPIPVKPRVRYLGLYYGPGTSFCACRDEIDAAGRKASFALTRALKDSHMLVPDIMLSCFNAQVRSVLSYGAEVWAPGAVAKLLASRGAKTLFQKACEDPAVKQQTAFLKRVAGAQVPTLSLLFTELGQVPMQVHWTKVVLRFWNRLAQSTGSTLGKRALRDILERARTAGFRGKDWGSQTLCLMRELGHNLVALAPSPQDPAALVAWLSEQQVPADELAAALAARLQPDWESAATQPRDVAEGGRNGVKLNRYKHWMGLPEGGKAHAHLAAGMTQRHHTVLLRFRLLCWGIAINRPGGQPRAERLCPNCSCMEDEYHVLFECSHYADLKAKHFDNEQGQLFCDVSARRAAAASIWPKLPPVAVAEFLMDVLRERGCMEEDGAAQLGGESD